MKEKDIFDNLTEESAGDKNVSSELLELSKKIDVLQGQMNAALELFKKDDVLTEIGDIYEDSDEGSMEDTSDNILDATIGVDIEKAVKDILKNNPRDVGSAQRKIRVCIENYCRYKKGIDLNDSLFFNGDSIFHKLNVVGIDQNKIERIASIYRSTNGFIHDDIKVLAIETKLPELRRAIISASEDLHEWGIDDVDFKVGITRLYTTKDRRLLQLLDDKVADINLVSEKELQYHFDKMYGLEEVMKKYGIAIPNIRFRNKQDIEDYRFDKKIQSQNGVMSSSDQAHLLARNQERANKGDFAACLWMADFHQNQDSLDKAVSFYLSAVRAKDATDKIKTIPTLTRVNIAKALFNSCNYTAALKWIDGLTTDSAILMAADCYYEEKKYDEAFAKYRLLPISSLAKDWRKRFVADRLFESDPSTAKNYYRQCETANSNPQIMKLIGDCCMAEGNKYEAIQEYEKIIARRCPTTYINELADIFANRVSYSEIVQIFSSRKQIVFREIADLFWDFQDKPRAISWYEKCNIGDISPKRQLDLGNHYLTENNVTKAIDYFSKYMSLTNEYGLADTLANYLLRNGHEDEAIRFYNLYASKTQSANTFRFLGDHYKRHNMIHKAIECYSSYVTIKKDYDFALKMAKELWSHVRYRDAVIILYEKVAIENRDVEVTKFLCDYYIDKNPSKELEWYKKYYNLGNEKNEEIVQHIIQINMQLNRPDDALEWKKKLADLLYDRGEVDYSIKVYQEYIKTKKDQGVILRLAEHYYFSNLYRDAEKMLSMYTKGDVFVEKGVVFCSDGSFFISHNKRLIRVTEREISRLETKHNFILKRTSAEIWLNGNAPADLPKKIKLFDNLPDNKPIVAKIREKADYDKRLAQEERKRIEKARKEKKKNQYKHQYIDFRGLSKEVAMLLAIFGTALGIILELSYVIYYVGCDIPVIESIAYTIACDLPYDDSILFWLCVGGIPFIINIVATMLSENPLPALLTVITPAVQYIINLQFQWWSWLDPRDGEPCLLEFIEYGIWLPFLSACLFSAVFYFVVKNKSYSSKWI